MKSLVFCLVVMLLVWLLLARPDRAAETTTLLQQLSSEADLRSQALTNVMQKHRLAAVLVARSGMVEDYLKHIELQPQIAEKIDKLAALSGVLSISVIKRGESSGFPSLRIPDRLLSSGQWQRGVRAAFQGRLGRAFFKNEQQQPVYAFFAPYFSAKQAPPAVVVVMVDLQHERDSWSSVNRVELWSANHELMLSNHNALPQHAVTVERYLPQLNASLRISAEPLPLVGAWLARSLLFGFLMLLGGVLLARQMERRRYLIEIAEQRKSEANRLELLVNERTEELKRVQNQLILNEKMALLGQMSASISHEINQPLAALKNYTGVAERLLDKQQFESVHKNLRQMAGLTDRISRIVVNLRSFATNESVPVQTVNVVEVVQEACKELFERFPESEQCCEVYMDNNLLQPSHLETITPLASAQAGRIRLLQVLNNVLSNAWQACDSVELPCINVHIVKTAEHIRISIEDNGSGIAYANRESVFAAFTSSKQAQTGLGLGLTISRFFVEGMGGSLVLDNSKDAGSCFIITLMCEKSLTIA